MPRQNTAPSDYPQAVLGQIEQLAQNIVIARKRRGESQAQWARRLGISQPTMARIERGDPSVAMASYVMCIWLINPAAGLADLIAPLNDHAALEKEVARVWARPKPRKQSLLSNATRTAETPSADVLSPKAGTTALSDLARLGADPMAELRKSLASTSNGSDTAKGLAALIAKSVSKKND